jgi:hypothetical protein
LVSKKELLYLSIILTGSAFFLTTSINSKPVGMKTAIVQEVHQAQDALMQDLASRLEAEPGIEVKNADNLSYLFGGCDYYGIYAVASGARPLKHIAVYTGRNSDQIALEDSCFAALPSDVQAGFQRIYVVNAPVSATAVDDAVYGLILSSLATNQPRPVIDYLTRTPVQPQSWGALKSRFAK